MELTDYELVKLCLNGEINYFSELITRYKSLVYSVIIRMIKNNDEVDDLAQDVFIKIYKNLDKYYPDYRFSTWIIRITTNHVIDFRRKKTLNTVDFYECSYELSTENLPEKAYLESEQKNKIKNILDQLPDMYKIPIILYHQRGLSYEEISKVIKQPLSKVKNRIFRARKMLKNFLINE